MTVTALQKIIHLRANQPTRLLTASYPHQPPHCCFYYIHLPFLPLPMDSLNTNIR